jgi:hypothetical protein
MSAKKELPDRSGKEQRYTCAMQFPYAAFVAQTKAWNDCYSSSGFLGVACPRVGLTVEGFTGD